MADWIEYDGKGMPVQPEARVVVRLRDGTFGPAGGAEASAFWWGRGAKADGAGEIISYCLHTTSESIGVNHG